MSLKSKPTTVVPEDTARVAKAVFKKGNRYVMLRDTFGDLFDIEAFTQLFSHEGKPALDPARLALITFGSKTPEFFLGQHGQVAGALQEATRGKGLETHGVSELRQG